jgi:hypothetical protein
MAACLALIPVASGWGGNIFLYLSLGGICSIFAALMTVLNTLAMDFARPGRGGSDFTMFISLSFFGGMICISISGLVAQTFGYAALFAGCAGLYVLLLVLLLWLYRGRREFNG